MNLTCPSCGATFRVEPAQLGPAGRKVRCGDCRHAWHQEPLAESEAAEQAAEQAVEQAGAKEAAAPFAPSEAQAETTPEPEPEPAEPEPPAAAVTPEATPEEAPGAAPGAEERVSRRAYSKPARPRRKAPQSSLAIGWALFVVVVVGLAAGFYFGRTPLVAMASNVGV